MKHNQPKPTLQQIYNIAELAIILGRSANSIRISISRNEEGITIPKSIKLGNRRLWRKSDIESFIRNLDGNENV